MYRKLKAYFYGPPCISNAVQLITYSTSDTSLDKRLRRTGSVDDTGSCATFGYSAGRCHCTKLCTNIGLLHAYGV